MTGRLITNVRILDGTGREPFAGSVRVEGNRIAEVSTGTSASSRAATTGSSTRPTSPTRATGDSS